MKLIRNLLPAHTYNPLTDTLTHSLMFKYKYKYKHNYNYKYKYKYKYKYERNCQPAHTYNNF